MWRLALFVIPPLALGLGLAFSTIRDRGRDPQFALDQRRLERPITGERLAATVKKAPEPLPGDRGRPARAAFCEAVEPPRVWSCRARYRTGARLVYRVVVSPDGRFTGETRDGSGVVFGQVPQR